MTRTRADRAKVTVYNARAWWYRLDAWSQCLIAACLLCVLELAVIWAVRPYLLQAVAS